MPSIAMLIAIFLLWFSPYTYVPILSTYAEAHGSSLTMVGLIIGSYGFVQLIMRIPIGFLSDHWKKRQTFLLLSFVCGVISHLLFLLFPSSGMLLLARSIAGLSVSHWAIFITHYQLLQRAKPQTASGAIGIVSIFQTTGTMLGMLVGGAAADQWGPTITFHIGGISALLGILFVLLAGRDHPDPAAQPMRPHVILRQLRDTKLLYYSLMTAVMHIVVASTLTGFMPSILRNVEATDTQIALATTLSSLPAVFGGPIGLGPLQRKLGLTGTSVLSFLCLAIGTLPFAFVRSIPLLILFAIIAGIGKGLLAPLLMAASTSHLPPSTRSTALGAHQALYSLGMSFGPALTGIFSQQTSIPAAYLMLSGIAVIAAIAMLLIPIRGRLD